MTHTPGMAIVYEAKCGCLIKQGIFLHIEYCPMHKAAPELLAELKDVLIDVASKYTYDKACKVIDKAEGKT